MFTRALYSPNPAIFAAAKQYQISQPSGICEVIEYVVEELQTSKLPSDLTPAQNLYHVYL